MSTVELTLGILWFSVVALWVFLLGELMGSRRPGWSPFDLIGVLASFGLWFLLATRHHPPKSLSNAATEPLLLALVVGLLAICRRAISSRMPATRLRVAFHRLSLLAAVCVSHLTPTLPE